MNKYNVLGYTSQQMDTFGKVIKNRFGRIHEQILHDQANLDGIHIDIVYVPATPEDPYHRFITMGSGAYLMKNGKRAEFMVTLPADWPVTMEAWKDEIYYWPIRLIQDAARFSIHNHDCMDVIHTLDNTKKYASNTDLCACMLLDEGSLHDIVLDDHTAVSVLQVAPLYREELDLCNNNCNAYVMGMAKQFGYAIIDPKRKHHFLED